MRRRRLLALALPTGLGAALLANPAAQKVSGWLEDLGVPVPWYRRPVTTTYSYCDMCPYRCGIVVRSVNGTVAKIDGNPKDPKSRGMLCARGQAGVSFIADPARLRTPLIRTGPRGEWSFREASWDEALDLVATRMLAIRDRYGPESVAFFAHGSGDFWFGDYVPRAWGSPNSAKPSTSLCTSPREEAAILTAGRSIGNHEPVDWDETGAIALIGTHVGEDTRNTLLQGVSGVRARGGTIVVVDPRFSSVAMKADHWLPVKPGTDTALLLAWTNVLIRERLYDAEFVRDWTVGFDELAAHVASLTPEWASTITELPASRIRDSIRALAASRPRALIVPGRHVTWYGNDTQRMRAVYIVNALLGAYGRRGGLYICAAPYVEEYPHPPFQAAGGGG